MIDRFDLWLTWLRSLGGSYEFLRTEKSDKIYDRPEKPTPRPLNPHDYYKDDHGSVRKKKPWIDDLAEDVLDGGV